MTKRLPRHCTTLGNCYLCSQQNQAKFYFFGCLGTNYHHHTKKPKSETAGNISLVFQFKIRVSLLNWHSRHIVSQILDSISLHSKHQILRIKQDKQLKLSVKQQLETELALKPGVVVLKL